MPGCRLYAAPGALGGVLAYVGLNYDKLETWVTEFGTNMKDEQLLDDEAVSGQSMEPASLTMTTLAQTKGPGTCFGVVDHLIATRFPSKRPRLLFLCVQALHDQYRIQFYHAYLNNACQAIERYSLNVKKMFAWTFLDNFEWCAHSLAAGLTYRPGRS